MQFFPLLLCCSFLSCLSASPSVIIIGAGPSGIAAATKLLENSFDNITILEAENRIGGRVYSVPLEDGAVDVGAEYCHGEIDNVVYQAVKNLDLLEHSKPLDVVVKMYYSNGSIIDNGLALSLLNATLEYESVVDLSEDKSSLGDKYLKWYNNTFIAQYKNDQNRLKIVTEAIKLSEQLIISNEGSFNWHKTKVKSHNEDCEGDQRMTWRKNGYHTILNVLMKKIPKNLNQLPVDDKIVLNKTVAKITWSKNKAEVETLDGEVYKADHVIFTPSLGVLQNRNVVFNPLLPKKKLEAIDALGIDAVMKIVLHFAQPWWKTDFLFLWSEEDLGRSAKDFPFGYSRNEISWVTSISAFARSANPNVLIAWVTGDMIPEIEKLPEDIIKNGVMFVAKKFLKKDYNISEPDLVIRSNWYSNPNFRGSYSYEKTESYQKNISYNALLAEPLTHAGNPILQFAGEATSPTHYASVHGAIETGWREAQRVIDLYNDELLSEEYVLSS